jgi:hypothetical protein
MITLRRQSLKPASLGSRANPFTQNNIPKLIEPPLNKVVIKTIWLFSHQHRVQQPTKSGKVFLLRRMKQ